MRDERTTRRTFPARGARPRHPSRRLGPKALVAAVAATVVGAATWPATGQPQPAGAEPALPENVVVVDVDAVESQTFQIGIPDLLGGTAHGAEAGEILRRDFTLMPGYRVIPARQIRHDLEAEGLGIQPSTWGALDAKGVIKGRITGSSSQLRVELRFYQLSRGATPLVEQDHTIAPRQLRRTLHDFGNEILRVLTGEAGPFGTVLTFGRREAPGRKDVMCAGMDGHDLHRVTNGQGIAMLPSFDPAGNIWFTRLTQTGMFITRTGVRGRAIIEGNGLNMAPSVCDGRVYFASSRDGNAEIYSARTDGSDLRRLTNHPAIDVSPTCGPRGKVAFVSARHGSPQIWTMGSDGSDQRRVTYRGTHNQTPAFCPHPSKPLLAFTGRDQTLDIFTLNLATSEYTRITQGQGMNKDPSFSPDCRIVAFTSNRRGAPGIYLASPSGFNQHLVVEGEAETVRWSGRWPPGSE